MVIGTWNVLSFTWAGSLRYLKDGLEKYIIGIATLQEERNGWRMLKEDNGRLRLEKNS
jgi:hypothetical protein